MEATATRQAHPRSPRRRRIILPVIITVIVCFAFVAKIGIDITDPHPNIHLLPDCVSAQGTRVQCDSIAGHVRSECEGGFNCFAKELRHIAADLKVIFRSQWQTLFFLVMFAFVPAFISTFYGNSFWRWFCATFGVLLVINTVSFIHGTGSISEHWIVGLNHSYWYYILLESIAIALLLVARIRPTDRQRDVWEALAAEGAAKLHLGPKEGRRAAATDRDKPRLNRYIVVCIDGTWNHPGQLDHGASASTNVHKLWMMLRGEENYQSKPNANRCKVYYRDQGSEEVLQTALYYHGVGNRIENSALVQLFGGAFGFGAVALKERAYLDVVRSYHPGDRICLFGFSRGAAIARLLASAIDSRGVPKSAWTLRMFGRQFPIWMSKRSRYPVDIEILGCWDTVAAFGIPKPVLGIQFQKINLFKNLDVPDNVNKAYHMVALDEDRDAFEPTLMNPDPVHPYRIEEIWFPGNHANVGGGYATDGLSDITLDFLLSRISSGYSADIDEVLEEDRTWGIYLDAYRFTETRQSEEPADLAGKYKDWDFVKILTDIKINTVIANRKNIDVNVVKDVEKDLSTRGFKLPWPRKIGVHPIIRNAVEIERFYKVVDRNDADTDYARVIRLQALAAEKALEGKEGEVKKLIEKKVQLVKPNPGGVLREQSGSMYKPIIRDVPLGAVIHDSVFERMQIPECRYYSEALFKLAEKLTLFRENIEAKVHKLGSEDGTASALGSIDDDERDAILAWAKELTIRRYRPGTARFRSIIANARLVLANQNNTLTAVKKLLEEDGHNEDMINCEKEIEHAFRRSAS